MSTLKFLPVLALITPLLLPTVLAIPNVSTFPLGSNDCSRWPAYVDFDFTAPLHFVVDSADNAGVNGLLTTTQSFTLPGSSTTSTRIVVDPRKPSVAVQQPTYRCVSGILRLPPTSSTNSSTVAAPSQQEPIISVAMDYRNAFLILGDAGNRIAPYGHTIDEVDQPGVYIGARGRTTWGFRYHPAGDGGMDYYEIKLTGLPEEEDIESSPGAEPEFYGFLKAVAA